MNPVMIRIMAVVGIIIGFVFMGLLYGYNEQLYASLSPHCNIDSERVITVRASDNSSLNFNLIQTPSATTCTTGTVSTVSGYSASSGAYWETPNGSRLPGLSAAPNNTLSATVITGSVWNAQIGLGGQFRTLTFLLIAVIPLALVAAVIAQAVPLIMSGGSSNVTDIVNKQTMGLLIAAAVIIAAPILFEQASSAKDDLVGLGSAAQFLTITNLIFDLVPLVYTIGVMGLIIYGSGLVQRFGGKQKMGGMMGM